MNGAPIFISARFRTGSTLLWNLFHQIPDAHAYYEPLHEQLPELIQRRISPQARHYNVDSYFLEYPEINDLKRHHSPEFGLLRLYLDEDAAFPRLSNYIHYLLNYPDKSKKAVFQFNRVDFRLPWIKFHFPDATLIHLYRSPRDQWVSMVGDADNMVDLDIDNDVYRITAWSRDLCQQFPFLATPFLKHAYQRHYYLWKLSYIAGKKFSDLSISYEELIMDPINNIKSILGLGELDSANNIKKAEKILVRRPLEVWKNYRSNSWFEDLENECEEILDTTGLNKHFGSRPLHEIIASNQGYQNLFGDKNIGNWAAQNGQLSILRLSNRLDEKESVIQMLKTTVEHEQHNENLINEQKDELLEQQKVISAQKDQLLENERKINSMDKAILEKEKIIQSFRHSAGFWLTHGPLRYIPLFKQITVLLIRIKGLFDPKIGILEQYRPRPAYIPPSYAKNPEIRVNEAPLISIVTPSFNQAEFIERTVKSVIDQKYPKLQYVVQDGNSSDGSQKILESYQDGMAHFESRKDNGQAHAINLGFRHTSGEIMAYLNSDDMLVPGALHYVARFFLDNPDVDVIYGHRIIVNKDDQEIGIWVMPRHDPDVLLWADYIPQETIFWRRRIWDAVGGKMDESFQFALDWDLLLRFQQAGANFVRVPRFLGFFRYHIAQKSTSQIDTRGIQEMDRLRKNIHGRDVDLPEVFKRIRPYLKRSIIYHNLYRFGIFRY